MNENNLSLDPEKFQPSGHADFSKIYSQKEYIVSYPNQDTKKIETHIVKTKEIIDEMGNKTFELVFPILTQNTEIK